jgi:hypothetical protein
MTHSARVQEHLRGLTPPARREYDASVVEAFMPRFAVLHHDHPEPHLDLLLEAGEAAWTWRLREWPTLGHAIPAERLADHRLLYLEYEGEVSGGRGTVKRLDGGEYDLVSCPPSSPGRILARLYGSRLRGVLELCEGEEGFWEARLTQGGEAPTS